MAPVLLSGAPEALQAAWLPRIAAGDARVVLAHQESGARYRLDRVETRLAAADGGWRLSGGASGIVHRRGDPAAIVQRPRRNLRDPE